MLYYIYIYIYLFIIIYYYIIYYIILYILLQGACAHAIFLLHSAHSASSRAVQNFWVSTGHGRCSFPSPASWRIATSPKISAISLGNSTASSRRRSSKHHDDDHYCYYCKNIALSWACRLCMPYEHTSCHHVIFKLACMLPGT